MEIKSISVPAQMPKIGKGAGLPDGVFDEIHNLYPSTFAPADGTGYQSSFGGGAYDMNGKNISEYQQLSDVDRATGFIAKATRTDKIFGGKKWNLSVHRTDGSALKFPMVEGEELRVADVTVDAKRNRVVLDTYNDNNKRWVLTQYDVSQEPGFFEKAIGQDICNLEGPTKAIEFTADGQLLVADKQEVKVCQDGKLMPFIQFPGEVQDINSLSNGGLCVRVTSPNYLNYELYYVDPQGQAPLNLALTDTIKLRQEYHPQRPAEFIKKFSDADTEKFLESNSGKDAWFWELGYRDSVETSSPVGEHTMALDQRSQRIMARSAMTDLGCIAEFTGDNRPSPRFKAGLDGKTACWSDDGRLFAVCSKTDADGLDNLRDVWVWDTEKRVAHTVPNIRAVEAVPGGSLRLDIPGGDSQVLKAETLDGLSAQDWFKRIQKLPQVTQKRDIVTITPANGGEAFVVEDSNRFTEVAVSGDGTCFFGISEGREEAVVWDLEVQIPIKLPPSQHIYWDSKRDHLGVVHQDGQFQTYNSSQIRQSDWYRQALEKLVGGGGPAVAVGSVEHGKDGVTVNGLTLPRKKRPGIG